MAHNPKLQIFTIELNPKAKHKKSSCFRSFFQDKCFKTEAETKTLSEKAIFKQYHQDFIKGIDVNAYDFFKDEKNKKAITIYDTKAIKRHDAAYIIEGIVKGGRYDQEREKANLKNKKVEKVEKDDVILDQFYFLLYTPLNSCTGILFLQSYTEDSICDVFCKLLKSFFQYDENYFDIKIRPYMPQNLKDEYKKKAKLKGFSFSTKEIIGIIGKGAVSKDQEEFAITIEIKPSAKSGVNKINQLMDKLLPIKFHNRELDKFSKRVYLEDDAKNAAYYDIGKDINKIKPTIYLENRIPVSIKTGLPDFDKLKEFCELQLIEIKKEFSQSRIHEASVVS